MDLSSIVKFKPLVERAELSSALYAHHPLIETANELNWESFCQQFDLLLDYLATQSVSVLSAQDMTELHALKAKVRDRSLTPSDRGSYTYYAQLKASLEAFGLLMRAASTAERKQEVASALLENLGVCGPGLLTHKQEGLQSLTSEDSYLIQLAKLRERIIKHITYEHIRRNNISAGKEVHVFNYIANYLEASQGFAAYSLIPEDHFATAEYCQVLDQHHTLFEVAAAKAYKPVAVINHLAEHIKAVLDQTFTDGASLRDYINRAEVESNARINASLSSLGLPEGASELLLPTVTLEEAQRLTGNPTLSDDDNFYIHRPSLVDIKNYVLGVLFPELAAADSAATASDGYEISVQVNHFAAQAPALAGGAVGKIAVIKYQGKLYLDEDFLLSYPEFKTKAFFQNLINMGANVLLPTGFDFSGLDLSGMDLSGAFLPEDAQLTGVTVYGAKLDGYSFWSLFKAGVRHFADTDLSQVHFKLIDQNYSHLDLSGAKLYGSSFTLPRYRATLDVKGAKLDAVSFNSLFQEGVRDFRGVDLSGVDLTNKYDSLSRVNLSGAKVQGATLDVYSLKLLYDTGIRDFSGVKIHGPLWGLNLSGASFANADFSKASDLDSVVFSVGSLEGAKFHNIKLGQQSFMALYRAGVRDFRGVDLSGANLAGLNLSDIDLRGANLVGANLQRANLSNAKLTRLSLERARLDGAKVEGAQLDRNSLEVLLSYGVTNFKNVKLRNLDLSAVFYNSAHTNFLGADVTGSDLLGTCFLGSAIHLSGAPLTQERFHGLYAWGVRTFRGVDLSGLDLRGKALNVDPNTPVAAATLDYLSFTALYNSGVRDFSRITLDVRAATRQQMALIGQNFKESDFTGLTVIGPKLSLCEFKRAHFKDTLLAVLGNHLNCSAWTGLFRHHVPAIQRFVEAGAASVGIDSHLPPLAQARQLLHTLRMALGQDARINPEGGLIKCLKFTMMQHGCFEGLNLDRELDAEFIHYTPAVAPSVQAAIRTASVFGMPAPAGAAPAPRHEALAATG